MTKQKVVPPKKEKMKWICQSPGPYMFCCKRILQMVCSLSYSDGSVMKKVQSRKTQKKEDTNSQVLGRGSNQVGWGGN